MTTLTVVPHGTGYGPRIAVAALDGCSAQLKGDPFTALAILIGLVPDEVSAAVIRFLGARDSEPDDDEVDPDACPFCKGIGVVPVNSGDRERLCPMCGGAG